jgi:phage tail sheath gpL-like
MSPIAITREKPGTFFEFSYTSARGGFAPIPQRLALLGVQTASLLASNSFDPLTHRVLSPEDGDTMVGRGSELAMMIRAAFRIGSLRGRMPEIYVVPLAAPSGGGAAATVTTIAVVGTPTVTDTLVIRIAGRALQVPVTPASTQNSIAAALEAVIDAAAAELPVTAGVATNTVTCTATSAGVWGNEVQFEKPSVPAGLTVTITQTVAGVGASDPEDALAATLTQDIFAIAMPNNAAGDVDLAADHLDAAWEAGAKKWRRVWFGENGTLSDAQTLAAANNYRMSVGALRGARSLPCEIAAACAALDYSEDVPNYNFDGALLALYGGDGDDSWTDAEIEALLDAGASPLQPSDARADRAKVVKLVTTQVAINGVPSLVLRDIVVPKVGTFIARQIDADYALKAPDTLPAIRDLVLDVDRRGEALRYVRNVETLKEGVTVLADPDVPSRALIKNPVEVVSPIHQAVFAIEVRV